MSLLHRFGRWSTDQALTGIETNEWVKLLAQNNWRVSPQCLPQAALVAGLSMPTTLLGRAEDVRFGRQLASVELQPPIFVVGQWHSGGSCLQRLLGCVPGLTFPTVHQVVLPGAFLLTRNLNLERGHEPAEDEIALAKLTGLSPYLGFMFPEKASHYDRFVDFIEVRQEERRQWQEALRFFLKKITLQTDGDRVVLRSAMHTGRIRILLEMFPEAKFVYMHRHPYELFAATIEGRDKYRQNLLQLPEEDWEGQHRQQSLDIGERLIDRYLDDRKHIGEGNLVELAWTDFAKNEIDAVRHLCDAFDLPQPVGVEHALNAQYNQAEPSLCDTTRLTKRDREFVWNSWRRSFEAFGYAKS